MSQRPGGYQPIDRHWLETGEWAPKPSRVRALTALVNVAREAEPAPERGRTSTVPARPFIGVTAAEASENIARALAMCPKVRPPVSGSRRD